MRRWTHDVILQRLHHFRNAMTRSGVIYRVRALQEERQRRKHQRRQETRGTRQRTRFLVPPSAFPRRRRRPRRALRQHFQRAQERHLAVLLRRHDADVGEVGEVPQQQFDAKVGVDPGAVAAPPRGLGVTPLILPFFEDGHLLLLGHAGGVAVSAQPAGTVGGGAVGLGDDAPQRQIQIASEDSRAEVDASLGESRVRFLGGFGVDPQRQGGVRRRLERQTVGT
mmetsp:Transcript_40190/g.84137  ORF Transcript_40190/g.84137 Transcript_40190/m.84137 type:complete len:224 (-) Transcript_40190:827-1498(-)